MNLTETAALLTLCASLDQRTIGETDVQAWQLVLADVDPQDAHHAVIAWYRDHPERILPAHIRAHARRQVRDRLASIETLEIDHDPDDVPGWLAAKRAGLVRAARPEQLRQRPVRALLAGAVRGVDE